MSSSRASGLGGLEPEGAELALLVLQQNADEAAQPRLREDRPELLDRLGTLGRDLAVLGLHDRDVGSREEDPVEQIVEAAHVRVLAIDLLHAGDRAQAELSLLEDADRAALVRDQRGRGVDDRGHDLVEVERRGDLPADREQRVELLDLLLGLVLPGGAQGAHRLPREIRQQLLVLGGELGVPAALVDEHERADRHLLLDHGDREHRLDGIPVVLGGERVVGRKAVAAHRGLVGEQVAHDRGADRLRRVLEVVVVVERRSRRARPPRPRGSTGRRPRP